MSIVGWLLLLVLLAAVGAVAARRSRSPLRDPADGRPSPAVRSGEATDDLASLGLSEARPAAPSTRRDRVDPSPRQPTVLMPAAREPEPRDIEVRAGGVRLGDGSPWNGRAVPLLLGSLSAHARGHVAVVRREGDAYTVVARTDGGSVAPVEAPAVRAHAPTDLDGGRLAGLVGGRGRAVPMGEYLVLIGGDGASSDRYLDLLAALTPGAEPVGARRTDAPAATPTATTPTATTPTATASAEPDADAGSPVPRAVLIGQEQDAARADGRPLAFALVTLADAEDRLTQDPPEAVAAAESALRLRLEGAEGVRRVEPFGDLLFGAFVDRDPRGAADWCDALAAGEPPLFIGAVAPADGDAADVRDAAAEALRDAYEKRGAHVVAA